ncbi:MAG: hypothetical protein BM560_18880 [Roseobacter sp. MedPE-SWde]|nr:hypothetical protein MED193_11827 [Roseobacter sp. MED193]OIQ38483.1 MAG: hypothetical protein BM560_18880 [Roseobacter sp. MedPE-SWde]
MADAGWALPQTGHKTLTLVQLYTEAAGREELENSAMKKLIARPNGTAIMANRNVKFATPLTL